MSNSYGNLSDELVIDYQCLQVALDRWRKNNVWADSVEFAKMPGHIQDSIITAARIIQYLGSPEERYAA